MFLCTYVKNKKENWMFTFQENTHFSQALPCSREEFWEQVKKPNTAWRIDARRAILAAVDASKTLGVAAIQTWLNNSEYQKFLLKKQNLKKESAKKAWAAKADAEKLLAFAQEIKDNSTAFIYSCREFDETSTGKGAPFRHRRLADCHLNGLVMLDIDHVENPMQIWYKLRENEELMKRVGLVHITSSSFGARILSADTRRIAPEPVFRVGSAPRSTASRRLDGAVSSGPREVQPRLFLWVRGSGVGPVSPSAERAAAGAVGYLSGLSGRSLRWNLH